MQGVSLPHAVRAALGAYAGRLRARFGSRVSEIVLFGSHARAEAHDESDVDVLVTIDDLTDAERAEAIDAAYFVDHEADEWVGLSPLVYSTEQVAALRSGGRRLIRDIDREGMRL